MAAQGRRPSTLNLYNRRLRLFGEWCSGHSIGPSEASIGQIADFLLYLFRLGRKVNTIRGYRSAIAAIHPGFQDGGSISESVSLNHLIKGMFLKRPTVRALVPPWSLSSVLETLAGPPFEPLHRSSLKHTTLKTVFLISLASGRRRGALRALSTAPGHITFLPHGVRLVPEPSFLAKNQTIDFLPQPIFPQRSLLSLRSQKTKYGARSGHFFGTLRRLRAFDPLQARKPSFLLTRPPIGGPPSRLSQMDCGDHLFQSFFSDGTGHSSRTRCERSRRFLGLIPRRPSGRYPPERGLEKPKLLHFLLSHRCPAG